MQSWFENMPALFGGGFAFVALISAYFWGADELVSKAAREQLGAALSGDRIADQAGVLAEIGRMLDRYLPWRTAPGTYLLNVLLLSFLAMAAVGVLYFTRSGGFWLQLSSGGPNTRNFLSQLLFDGLLKVSLVNAIGLLPHRAYIARLDQMGLAGSAGLLVMDVVTRLLLLIGISAAVWVTFALAFGSFGGNPRAALDAIVPTFIMASHFQNLSAIYVFAVTATSLPLFVAILVRFATSNGSSTKLLRGAMFLLPWKEKPVRALSLIAAFLMACFGLLGSALLAALM